MRKHVLLSLGACVLALAACSDRRAQDTLARAERDAGTQGVTPMNQSTADADVAVTRAIRDAITSDRTMSLDAQNVKVITQGGVVTLRGPVADDQEKAAIVALATGTPGVSRVDDQLEIARN